MKILKETIENKPSIYPDFLRWIDRDERVLQEIFNLLVRSGVGIGDLLALRGLVDQVAIPQLKEGVSWEYESERELLSFIRGKVLEEFSKHGLKGWDVEFDDIDFNGSYLSFQMYAYHATVSGIPPNDHFFFDLDYEDAETESMEEAKEVLASRIPDQISEFIAYILKKGR